MSRLQSQQAPQVIHRLLHTSKLFVDMPQDARDELSQGFRAIKFSRGDVIIRAGSDGRSLGVILEGQAAVMAREAEHTFRLATLEAGALFGEMSFFDPSSPRTADVVATSDGVAALLDSSEYERLLGIQAPAAELLERNVLRILADRIHETNATLAGLLTQTDKGLVAALTRFFFGKR